jgi:hypothetical protein
MKKVVSASAIVLVSAGAVAGCSAGTTTVREIPAAAASSGQAATPASAAPAGTGPAAASAPAEPTASTPAGPTGGGGPTGGAGPGAAVSYCGSPADQGGISVNADTSCPFAENVESAWESSGGSGSVTAYSPVTGLAYTMSCTASGTGYEVCTGGDNAYVEFPVTAVSAPTSASGQFDSPCTQCAVSTLSQSVATEQQAELEAAPSSDYDSADNASVNVALTPLGDNTYSATATDSDGDAGSGDTITVSPDGNSWSDTGMNWSGPDVDGGAADSWTTPAVSDYS